MKLMQTRRQDEQNEGPKTRRGGPHFQNTILDVSSNRWAKREMGWPPISIGGRGRASLAPPTGDGPEPMQYAAIHALPYKHNVPLST